MRTRVSRKNTRPCGVRELDQAESLGVVVEAVGLGVDGDGRHAAEVAGERVGLVNGPDPDGGGPHAL